MLGADLLCAPVLEDGARSRAAYLPPGPWYDFWTDEPLEGGRMAEVDAPLGRLPLFARGGSVLALSPVAQHTGETLDRPLELRAYLQDGRAGGALYEDDGHSMEFETGAFRRTTFRVRTESGVPQVETSFEGAYHSPRPEAAWEFIGK
jgi:alpha-glucosidase (family GH31 glycosyl hydrolase)